MSTERYTGFIKYWFDGRPFGFVRFVDPRDGRSRSVFVHETKLACFPNPRLLPAGTRVSFELGVDRAGRTQAINVAEFCNAGE